MKRLLIDANILLDVLAKREPHFADSSVIWKLSETEQVEGYISTLTVANIIYVMRKELDADKISDCLERLRIIFHTADFMAVDLANAAQKRWKYFEDAVQCSIAERIRADFIITRNVRDFKERRVMALTPSEFLARF